MMCRRPLWGKTALCCIFLLLFSLAVPSGAYAAQKPSSCYVLVYENLYPYGESHSDVLELYNTLRGGGADVYLVQAGGFDGQKLPENTAVVVVASGFDNESAVREWMDNHPTVKPILFDGDMGILPVRDKNPSIMICISEVYPFSDLNGLMDTAEFLHQRGIEFICTLMPMYENTDFKAFDRFVEVLSYVESQGGKFFIRFPVFNPDGTYSTDPKQTFSEALSLYRNKGLTVSGIEVSLDRLLTNDTLFEGLNLPVTLVTPSQNKLDSDTDYFEISKGINKYVYLSGIPFEELNPYAFSDQTSFVYRQVIRIDSLVDKSALADLLDIFKSRQLTVTDFRLSDYDSEYKDEDFTVSRETQTETPKSQLELFKEKELEKIKGDNLGADQKIQNYDISKLFHTVILAVIGIVLLLSIQLYVGRKLDVRKIFKK